MADFAMTTKSGRHIKTRYMEPPEFQEIPARRVKYKYAAELAKDLDLRAGCKYFAYINGTFIAGDFIEALIVEKDLKVKRLAINTYSLSEGNIDSLVGLLTGGYVDELTLIISDYFFVNERRNLIPYAYEQLDIDNRFQLAVCTTHCKTALIETHDGLFITVHGSANYRSSSSLEHIAIEESKELHNFALEVDDAILEKYATIKKTIPKGELWNTINK
jgi:hypothetical protein